MYKWHYTDRSVIFKNLYVYTYMDVTTIIEKKDHEFERDKERACGMVWRKEKQRGSNKIIPHSQ